jgi:hypothetical protein
LKVLIHSKLFFDDEENMKNSITSAGFSTDFKQWHIASMTCMEMTLFKHGKILEKLRFVQKTWRPSRKRMS